MIPSIVSPLGDSAVPFALADGLYALTLTGSVSYLLLGSERALVIDTGLGKEDVFSRARQITDKPLILANTHGHLDPIGCNDRFDCACAHPLEFDRIRRKSPGMKAIREGDVLDLGDRSLTVWELPGHTPGSLGFYESARGLLFCGDMVSERPLFLQFPYSDLAAFGKSMRRIVSGPEAVGTLLCCHGNPIQPPQQAERLRILAELILNNGIGASAQLELQTEDGSFRSGLYSLNGANIYYGLNQYRGGNGENNK